MDLTIVKTALSKLGDMAVRRSPEILVATGITGFAVTVALTAKAAPKVKERWEAHKSDILVMEDDEKQEEAKRLVKDIAPMITPIVLVGVASVVCVLLSHRVQSKRAATVATAYALAEKTLTTYQQKAIEKLGEEGHKEIMQAVSDKLAEEEKPFDGEYSYQLDESGKCLCYDRVTGRYFKSTPDAIREAESYVNKRLIDEVVVSLSEFYFKLGLDDNNSVCNGLGWDLSKDKLDVYFTSMLDDDKRPCLVVNYNVSVIDRRIFEGRR